MNPRRTNNKSMVPRFCAFFLAQRREARRPFTRSNLARAASYGLNEPAPD